MDVSFILCNEQQNFQNNSLGTEPTTQGLGRNARHSNNYTINRLEPVNRAWIISVQLAVSTRPCKTFHKHRGSLYLLNNFTGKIAVSGLIGK
ncbi:hypothetical protein ElyMa_001944400 [Elysia marginata]|uniref:Uncharacterized protein n=1 Tax=Elysia marginata TaxID=1093978 RepID=A0AAV4EXQ0_9GAST|nr:hypothetical protein ElyMa_001944400 [Elysia marginata]